MHHFSEGRTGCALPVFYDACTNYDACGELRFSYFPGARVSSCVLAVSTAASVNASVNVVLLYQASQWSIKCGLKGWPDSPSTRLKVELCRLEKSTVMRSEGPKPRPTCFTV